MTSTHRFARPAILLVIALLISRPALADTGEAVTYGLAVLVVFLILALIGREIHCWYHKINERCALLREIRDELKILRGAEAAPASPEPVPEAAGVTPEGKAEDPWT